jgi:5-formyltetrahydrofolate cyclo-ligase
MAVADEKQYLRTVLSEARRSLAFAVSSELSARIQAGLIASSAYCSAGSVVLYSPCDGEAQTGLIAVDALARGKRLYYPAVDRSHRSVRLRCVSDLSALLPGAFGILEPPDGSAVEPDELTGALICVPGVAFTPGGARLGRGGGYYDRLLAGLGPGIVTAGLSYSFQLIDRLPQEAWDRRLDLVFTESAVYATGDAPRAAARPADQGGKTKWTC